MRSHIHELWEDLELTPLYPEPDLDRVMDRVISQIQEEEPELPSGQTKRRRPMHKKKLLLSLAAALVVLTGSAVAVANHYGVLDLFFTGDTSALEPYVQTDLGSSENEDFRFTVNSAYYDGMSVYAVVTVEGLNEQAVEDLKENRADADAHREAWGDAMAEHMLETGGSGPDTIRSNQNDVTQAAGFWYSGGSSGIHELESPSDTSRSWQVDFTFQRWLGPLDTPLKVWAGLMGEEYAVEIPLDHTTGAVHLETDRAFVLNPLTGQQGALKEVALSPTMLYYRVELRNDPGDAPGWEADDWFALRMADGSVKTANELDASSSMGYDIETGERNYRVELQSLEFSQASQAAALILGDTEFPLDGSEPFPAQLEEKPFFCRMYADTPWRAPFEALCRGLGADYAWDEETQTAVGTYRDVTIQVTAGASQILVDDAPVDLYETREDETGTQQSDSITAAVRDGDLVVPNYALQAWDLEFWPVYDENGGYTDMMTVLP